MCRPEVFVLQNEIVEESCDFNLLDDKNESHIEGETTSNQTNRRVSICNKPTTLNSLQNDVPSHLPNNFSLSLLFLVSRAVWADQDVENANIFQMSGDFVYEVSSFVVSAAPHIDVLSMTLGSWHSGAWISRDTQPPCVSSLNEKMFGHDYLCLKSAYNGALLFEQTKRL